MTQKVNSNKLKEIYFNPPSSVRPFNEPFRYNEINNTSHALLDSDKYYKRYSEEEISKFEKFFNKHYYHPNTETEIPILKKQENMNLFNGFEPLVTDNHLEKAFDFNLKLNKTTFTSKAEAHTGLDKIHGADIDSEAVAQIAPLENSLLEQSAANIETISDDFALEDSVLVTTNELLNNDGNSIVDETLVKHPFDVDVDLETDTSIDVEKLNISHNDIGIDVEMNESSNDETLDGAHEDIGVVGIDVEMNKPLDNEKLNVSLDDDLSYLESLVSNGGNGMATTPLGSLGHLLDEIVDNEKHQISNYETDVFNANIQSLLSSDPEADLPPVPHQPSVPKFSATPPIPPTLPVISNKEGVDDKAIKNELAFSDSMSHNDSNDDAIYEDSKIDIGFLNNKFEPSKDHNDFDTEKEAHDDFTDFIPDKELGNKHSKLNLLDTILVILFLIFVTILVFRLRYLLPLNLPFMNRI